MTENDTISLVVQLIKRCATKFKIEPYLIDWNMFQAFAIEDFSKNGKKFDNSFKSFIKRLGGYNNIRDAHFMTKVLPETQLIKELASENRKVSKSAVNNDLFIKRLEASLSKVVSTPIHLTNYKPPKAGNIKRCDHLEISDIHLGAKIDGDEGTHKFGLIEASRRMAKIAIETADFKPQYRENTKLVVNFIGDIIQGLIHDPYEGFDESTQFCLAVWTIEQFLCYLANHFPLIEVHMVPGNHDRIPSRHKERPVNAKWNSYATMVYYAVKRAVLAAGVSNVSFTIHKTPWITYRTFGHNYWASHGDTVFNVGYPGSNLNVKNIENQINKLNASLADAEEYDVLAVGHVHTGCMVKLSNGVTLLVNPPLVPPDAYANSIGIWENQCGQWLYESVPDYAFGDSRFLTVNEATDSDSGLDKVINPYIDFNKT